MSIVVVCPGCKKRLTLGDDRAGSEIDCPVCKRRLRLPSATPKKPEKPAKPTPPAPRTPVPVPPTPPAPHGASPPPLPPPAPPRHIDDEPEPDPDDEPEPYVPRRRKKHGVNRVGVYLVGFLALVVVVAAVALVVKHNRVTASKTPAVRTDTPTERTTPRYEPARYEPPRYDTSDTELDRGRIAGLSVWGFICLVGFLYLLVSVLIAIWVIQDTRNRSVENGLIWMLLMFPFNFLAFLIYMASRPAGSLIHCEHCGNKRLAYVGICPHCRQPVTSYGRVA